MPRVLLVDDDAHVCRAVRNIVERAGHEVAIAMDGATGVDLAATWAPDLVILDLNLPDLSGIEVVERTRPWLAAPILVLSGEHEERKKVAALEAGADDYLVKPFGVKELVARLGALLRRQPSEAVAPYRTFGDLVVDLAGRTVQRDGREVRITPTEWRLLEGFVTHPGALLTHRWLLENIWDSTYAGETREALRVHIRSLRSKLGDDAGDPRYIRTESGAGYRWLAAEDEPRPVAAEAVPLAVSAHDINNTLAAIMLGAYQAVELAAEGDQDAAGQELVRMETLVQGVVAAVRERAPAVRSA